MPEIETYKTLYFLKYNNYANRKLKREASLEDYLAASYNNTYIQIIQDCKLWNPNDGITTTITTPNNTNFDVEPDYLIVADGNDIDSKWFIVETVRVRKGQYKCTLKRDVFAEAWDDLVVSTCHIDRAILSDNNPLTFNSEPITVNQIPRFEYLLKDKSDCPWVVMYTDDPSITGSYAPSTGAYDVKTEDSVDEYVADKVVDYFSAGKGDIQIQWRYKKSNSLTEPIIPLNLLPYGFFASSTTNPNATVLPFDYPSVYPLSSVPDLLSTFKTYYSKTDADGAAEILGLDGKILYSEEDHKTYKLNVKIVNHSVQTICENDIYTAAKSIVENNLNHQMSGLHPNANTFTVFYKYATASVEYTEVYTGSTITVQTPSNAKKAEGSPYYIFTWPLGNIVSTVGDQLAITDQSKAWMIYQAFASSNSVEKIWDFQILPYCPLPDKYLRSPRPLPGNIYVDDENEELSEEGTAMQGDTAIGAVYCVPYASYSKQITCTCATPYGHKFDSIIHTYRLYSPNYQSSFEFVAGKNGNANYYDVRCTLLPINPYIRVSPSWGGLYGTNKDEVRGLVLAGDFSMARVNNSWVSYQEQNKNFEAIFNRQIENMDVMHKYDRIGGWIQAGTGAVAGAAGGAAVGSMVPGIGTAVGAGVGAATSLIAGAADVSMAGAKYKESKSYATDLHEMQLGNIQAMPHTLARGTSFNIDNRFFPILTVYECTQQEMNYVNDFIINRSMAVGIIAKPQDFLGNEYEARITDEYGINQPVEGKVDRGFIQGSIVYIDTKYDTHFVDELNNEFSKGVFTK